MQSAMGSLCRWGIRPYTVGSPRNDGKSVAFVYRLLPPPQRDALRSESQHAERWWLRLLRQVINYRSVD
jgi:hypothetical protein